MTQLDNAKKGIVTEEMKIVAKNENISVEKLIKDIAAGHTIIIKSKKHDCEPVGIGKDLKIKVNSNIGTSNFNSDMIRFDNVVLPLPWIPDNNICPDNSLSIIELIIFF